MRFAVICQRAFLAFALLLGGATSFPRFSFAQEFDQIAKSTAASFSSTQDYQARTFPDSANNVELFSRLFFSNLSSKNFFYQPDSNLRLERKRSFSAPRLALVTGAIGAANWALYHQLNGAWWREPRTHFHFYRGYRRTHGAYDFAPSDSYYYHLDKAGHFYSSIIFTHSLRSIYQWTGFSERGSDWMAGAAASLLMLEIEIYDGFFRDWGFSLGDFAANELGVLWAIAQTRSPKLRQLHVKASYDPFAKLEDDHWIKNYGAMTFWLSFSVRPMLPEAMQKVWPKWLNLAAGYGTSRLRHGRFKAYLAFDLNTKELFKSKSFALAPLKTVLTYLHLPLPALQIRPSIKFLPAHF